MKYKVKRTKKTKVVEKINLEEYGVYIHGLTDGEIKTYLKRRAGTTRLGLLYKQFCKVAGVNTTAFLVTECCGKHVSLMYRHDVRRFADLMFDGTPTYFD